MITQSHSAGRRFLLVAIIVVVALLAAALGAWLAQRPEPAWRNAVLYPQPREIAPFRLETGDGSAFTVADLEGHWDLLFFGFTHCPDICPNTLSLLDQVVEALEERGVAAPRVTLISVDPERDQGEQLQRYVTFFDADFRGATGSHEALSALTRDLGVAYYVGEHAPGAVDYTVDHSASVLVVDPSARLVGLLRTPLDPDELIADLTRLIED